MPFLSLRFVQNAGHGDIYGVQFKRYFGLL
ncbi:MAG: hypothetical protein K0R50_4630 [Eubacterium sp.]|jgi:hypothetical protein|nr:hypothetical protein [Eubacterium sp.]